MPEVTPTNVVINTIQALAAIPQVMSAVAGKAQGPYRYRGKDRARWFQRRRGSRSIARSGALHPTCSTRQPEGYSGADNFTFRVASGAQQSTQATVPSAAAPDPADPTPPAVLWVSPVDGARLPLPVPASPTRYPGRRLLSAGDHPVLCTARSLEYYQCERQLLGVDGQPVNTTVQYVAGADQGDPDPTSGHGREQPLRC